MALLRPKPSARHSPHHPQVTICFKWKHSHRGHHFLAFLFTSFARNGKLLFWNLPVWHLYSLTTSLCLVATPWPSLVKKLFSLLRFLSENLEHSFRRLSSRVWVEKVLQANWYVIYFSLSIIFIASFCILSMSCVCWRVSPECQTGTAISKMERISLQ